MTRSDAAPAATALPVGGRAAPSRSRSVYPLLLDAVIPVGVYYLARYGFDRSIVTALIISSILPVVRAVWSIARTGEVNGIATLVLVVNVAGIALSFVSGNPRVILAKDSGISIVIALGLLVSATRGRPLLSAALEPWLTRGDAQRTRAWAQLATESARFRTLTTRYDLVWGAFLLGDCVLRLVFVFTLPVSDVAGWLSTVLLVATVALASVVSALVAAGPLSGLVDGETQRASSPTPRAGDALGTAE